jgi:hypothetical protein
MKRRERVKVRAMPRITLEVAKSHNKQHLKAERSKIKS